MRKERSIEEVRAKDRERQAKWRAKNKVLSRERVAAHYGKERYPEMVEYNSREAKEARKRDAQANGVINNVTTPQKPVEKEVRHVPIDEAEDNRTPAEKARDEAYQNKARGGGARQMEPKQEEVTEEHLDVIQRLAGLVARKKQPKKGIQVDL
jgi:hypothetical protein